MRSVVQQRRAGSSQQMAKTCKNHQETVNVHNFNCETKWPFSRFPSKHGLFAVVLYFLLMFVLCLKLFLCSLHPKASGSMVRHYGYLWFLASCFYNFLHIPPSSPELLDCVHCVHLMPSRQQQPGQLSKMNCRGHLSWPSHPQRKTKHLDPKHIAYWKETS